MRSEPVVRSVTERIVSGASVDESGAPTPSVLRRLMRAAGLLGVWLPWAAVMFFLSLGALKEDGSCGGVQIAWLVAWIGPVAVGLPVTFARRGRFAVVPIAFAVATVICGIAAVTLTLDPRAWLVAGARALRLCE